MGPCDEPAGQVVAAMQADDFVVVYGSLAEVQAVAATVYEYSCTMHFCQHLLKVRVPVAGIVEPQAKIAII
jgi:hypothetical protein